MKFIKTYIIALIVFLIIDSIWLKTMTASFYRPAIGHLMAEKPNMLAAAGFYLFYILAVCILVIFPAFKNPNSLMHVFFMGAVLGAAAYGTYDFTGLAVYKNFPAKVAIIDTIWGSFVTASVSFITYWVMTRNTL